MGKLWKGATSKLSDLSRSRLIILASGYGSNLQAILDACEDGHLPAEVVAIVSDRKKAFALERAHNASIPAVYHPWKPYRESGKNRRAYDTDLANKVARFMPDLVILAGWMRLLTVAYLERFPMKVINLHPALLGTFPGTHAIERAFEAYQTGKIPHTGVMVHYVPDEGVDDGPLIVQEVVPIYPNDTVNTLEARIHMVEHRLIVDAVREVLEAKYSFYGSPVLG